MKFTAKYPVIGLLFFLLSVAFVLGGCSPTRPAPTPTLDPASQAQPAAASPTPENSPAPTETAPEGGTTAPATATEGAASTASLADVISVAASGSQNAYQFSVEIRSPDTGCEQYADWWEVVSGDGELIYRRVLLHSHVSEQPFTRSGGPVPVSADTVVIVRAHMNQGGYGGAAFQGSVNAGFEAIQLNPGFAADLEEVEPLPTGCAF